MSSLPKVVGRAVRSTVRLYIKDDLNTGDCELLVERFEKAGIPVGGFSPADRGKSVLFALMPYRGLHSLTLSGVVHNLNASQEDIGKILKVLLSAAIKRIEVPADGG